jgi:cytoskeletal protein RodZ
LSEKNTPVNNECGVGPCLSTARQALGLSLDDVARVTRISKSYLEAIEREEFSRLPSPAYCKGFLRIYAVHLNLPADDIIARYEISTGQPRQQKPASANRPSFEEVKAPVERARKRWVLPIFLLAVVIVLSFLIDTEHRPPVNRPAKPAPAVTAPAAPVLTPRSSAQITKPAVPLVETPGQKPAAPAPIASTPEAAGNGLILRIRVNQDSWLNIDLDGRFSQQYELKSGDIIEWKADSVITVDLANGGGVEAELNGKPLPSFGAAGNKAHVVLRSEGIVSR